MKTVIIVVSRRADAIPGSTLRVMTVAHRTTTGEIIPAGTEYQPQSIGHDADLDRSVARISVIGRGEVSIPAGGAVRS